MVNLYPITFFIEITPRNFDECEECVASEPEPEPDCSCVDVKLPVLYPNQVGTFVSQYQSRVKRLRFECCEGGKEVITLPPQLASPLYTVLLSCVLCNNTTDPNTNGVKIEFEILDPATQLLLWKSMIIPVPDCCNTYDFTSVQLNDFINDLFTPTQGNLSLYFTGPGSNPAIGPCSSCPEPDPCVIA